METALSTISTLPATPEELIEFFRKVKSEITSGNVKDPLKVRVQLAYVKKLIDQILEDDEINHVFNKEFHLYEAEKEFKINGAHLRIGEVGTKYFYEDCGDPVWFDLVKKEKEISEKRKERERFLKNIPPYEGVVEPESGVFITMPSKKSKTRVIVKI